MEPAAQDRLTRMMTGYWVSQAIYVAAELGIADLLRDGPRTVAELARDTNTDEESLYRLLRALASVEVFAEGEQRLFALTPMASSLRSDVPHSQRSMALMMGDEHYRVWSELLYSVQTGETAFDKVYGMPIFEYLQQNSDKGKIFDEAMTGIHGRETNAVLESYDFAGIRTLADIGGGNGSKLSTILKHYPEMRGILFDLPHVVERALPNLEAAGAANRCEMVGGDFFQSVPSGADTYMLRHIIHDWDDERARQILANCRAVLPGSGKVLVIESVIPPGNDPFFGKLLDLTMLLIPGGKERTEEQYIELFRDAGLMLTRIVPTSTEICVIEAIPA